MDGGEKVAGEKPADEAIAEPHQAAQQRHALPDEELAKQVEVGPDDGAALEDEPVGGDENGQP